MSGEGKLYDKEEREEIGSIVSAQREYFNSDQTKSTQFRVEMLRRLKKAIQEREEDILEALGQDLGKTRAEGYGTELGLIYQELNSAIAHVRAWSRPKRVRGTIASFPERNYVYYEPFGVVLILSPWNYPFYLTLAPLVDAMAAGNCALVKSSRNSPHSSALLRDLLTNTFPRQYICCLDAACDYDQVVNQRYDFIFFTGSPRVGRLIMKAASENLTPVCLELGGKSPCIVDETANLKMAARRIVWGKLLNAGQTCISIDYVVVEERVKDALIQEMQREIQKRYPGAEQNASYPRIISPRHFDRLSRLLQTGEGVLGGERNQEELKIAPAIFPQATFEDEIMKEEIFGPLLPVIGYQDLDEVVRLIKEREKPLACYIFTGNPQRAERLLSSISSGGGCVNDTIMQIANHHLPFGGVGGSGFGCYHGKYGFDLFSHKKGVVKNGFPVDIPLRYAPFNEGKRRLFRFFWH